MNIFFQLPKIVDKNVFHKINLILLSYIETKSLDVESEFYQIFIYVGYTLKNNNVKIQHKEQTAGEQ